MSDQDVDAQGEGKGLLADQNLYYMNKAGKALGFHLDNALIGVANGKLKFKRDHTASNLRRAVYVTVGLYVNKDGVLNDDRYEYKSLSVPLFDAIGYAIGRYLQGEF